VSRHPREQFNTGGCMYAFHFFVCGCKKEEISHKTKAKPDVLFNDSLISKLVPNGLSQLFMMQLIHRNKQQSVVNQR